MDWFGRLAELLPARGYEPHDLIEENNSEVAPTLSQGLVLLRYNSRDDDAMTSVESEINDAQITGMLASLPYREEREDSANQPRIHVSGR